MKKKILIVCNSNFVYEKFIHEQKIFLQKKGYEIDVLIGEKKNIKKKTSNSLYFVDIPQNKINFLKKFYFCCNKIKKFIEAKKYFAVIHNNRNSSICSRTAMAFSKSNAKSIYFARGFYFHDNQNIFKKTISVTLEIFFLVFTDLILSQTKEDLKKINFFTNFFNVKIFYIGNGVKYSKKFVSQKKFTETIFLAICRISPGKGLENLFFAFNEIKKKYKTKLIIVGGPRTVEDKKYLKRLQNSYDLKQVRVTGLVKNIKYFLLKANFYILPSLREGLSRSLLEAMSQGLIPITSNVRGSREVIINNKNGFIYDLNDKKKLLTLMSSIFTLTNFKKSKIKKNAIDTVKKNFLLNRYFELQYKFINSLK